MWLARILGNVTSAESVPPGRKIARSSNRSFKISLTKMAMAREGSPLFPVNLLWKENIIRERVCSSRPAESDTSGKFALTVAGFITQNPDSAGKATGAAAAVSLENPKEYTAANSGQRNGCRHE